MQTPSPLAGRGLDGKAGAARHRAHEAMCPPWRSAGGRKGQGGGWEPWRPQYGQKGFLGSSLLQGGRPPLWKPRPGPGAHSGHVAGVASPSLTLVTYWVPHGGGTTADPPTLGTDSSRRGGGTMERACPPTLQPLPRQTEGPQLGLYGWGRVPGGEGCSRQEATYQGQAGPCSSALQPPGLLCPTDTQPCG